jgi:hypothetical protein
MNNDTKIDKTIVDYISVSDPISLSRVSYRLGQYDLSRLSDEDKGYEPCLPISEQYRRFLVYLSHPLGFYDMSYENQLMFLAKYGCCDEMELVSCMACQICNYLKLNYLKFDGSGFVDIIKEAEGVK